MENESIRRNPVYRAYPEAVLRLLASLFRHPSRNAYFETTLFWGDRLTTIYDSCMGQFQWRFGLYDLPVCEVIARILKPGDRALDIGASVGQMTLLMGRAVGLAGHVDSFEPHPAVFRLLRRNCEKSRFGSCITIRQSAISDRDGAAGLNVPTLFGDNIGTSSLEDGGSIADRIDVSSHTLDSLYPADTTLDLIKIDVEGHEHAVLRGARKLLQNKAIRCIVLEERLPEQSRPLALLAEHGYHLFAINWREDVVENLICELGSSKFRTENYLALRDKEDATRIRAFSTLAIKRLAARRLAFTFCPGRVTDPPAA